MQPPRSTPKGEGPQLQGFLHLDSQRIGCTLLLDNGRAVGIGANNFVAVGVDQLAVQTAPPTLAKVQVVGPIGQLVHALAVSVLQNRLVASLLAVEEPVAVDVDAVHLAGRLLEVEADLLGDVNDLHHVKVEVVEGTEQGIVQDLVVAGALDVGLALFVGGEVQVSVTTGIAPAPTSSRSAS